MELSLKSYLARTVKDVTLSSKSVAWAKTMFHDTNVFVMTWCMLWCANDGTCSYFQNWCRPHPKYVTLFVEQYGLRELSAKLTEAVAMMNSSITKLADVTVNQTVPVTREVAIALGTAMNVNDELKDALQGQSDAMRRNQEEANEHAGNYGIVALLLILVILGSTVSALILVAWNTWERTPWWFKFAFTMLCALSVSSAIVMCGYFISTIIQFFMDNSEVVMTVVMAVVLISMLLCAHKRNKSNVESTA